MSKRLIVKLIQWRTRFLPDRIFIIVVSIIIGILAGLIAVALKTSVHAFQEFLTSFFSARTNLDLYIIFPIIGLTLSTIYVRVFRKGVLSRGIGNVLVEISKKKGVIAKHKLYSQLITSFFTLGFGGSAGLEAPISVTGAAVGSNTAGFFRLSESHRKLLLGCGAAGGIAAIFNSPIAGVLFAVEIILSELVVSNFIPLIISSASATVVSKFLYTGQPFKLITESWELASIPYYIALGIICALISLYMIKVYYYFYKTYGQWNKPYIKTLIGGLSLGILLFLFPALFGEGYNIVENLLDGEYLQLINNSLFAEHQNNIWFLLVYAFLIMMLKIIATSITVNSGGNGGVFGSSLFVGALLGFIYARLINLWGHYQVTEVNFIVVAMAGILAGTIHAPLTAIFLIAEITGGYALFIPLMIVVALSYFISIYFEPYSAYTKGIAMKGEFILYNRDRLILENISIQKLIEKDFIPVNAEDTLGEFIEIIEQSRRNIFPVLDKDEKLVGIVLLDDVREIIFERHMYNLVLIKDVMIKPPAIIDIKENTYDIVKKFDELNVWNLPVTIEGKYAGFISKSSILSHYRDLLVKQVQR